MWCDCSAEDSLLAAMRQTIAVRDSGLFDYPLVDDNFKVRDVANEIISGLTSEDAFYIVDIGSIITKFELWKKHLPRVEPFYAVKCNETDCVLQLMATLGVGFDCASKGEIQKVKEFGVSADRIIYANPCKSNSHLKAAAGAGVDLMTFDNDAELYKIKQVYPSARLVVRIRADADEAQCPLGIKFGADIQVVPHLLAVAANLGLNVVGVSFHVGSGCSDLAAFPRAIEASRAIFDLASQMGFNFSLLDIGGGFPGGERSSAAFSQMASLIRLSLDEHFPEGSGVRLISEPGRFFVTSAFTLVTCIIGKRQAKLESVKVNVDDGGDDNRGEDHPGNMYYVNDGVYGSFNCILFDHQVVTAKLLHDYDEGTKLYQSSVWGPTCDSLDCILPKVTLPSLEIGDWVMWPDMGAYTVSAASTFNGFPKSVLHPVIPRSFRAMLKSCEDETDEIPVCSPRLRTLSSSCGLSLDMDLDDGKLSSVMDNIAYIFPFEISIDV
ncbi:unnamed protein product [Notodromas monacha]|uniref:ornithine decarboxylase n=1 Tax=Notodromas monacha TaxID=399045 RepID=A0A7R9GEM9_9CRUS|nr:unnamed protein product [Notodromas monacha]CAG0919795.1 unnamed protein product [Notodromas monacha]